MKNIDPSEINIINYLTGEMSTEELKQFEIQLSENELLRLQVEELSSVQDQLDVWGNQGIEIPDLQESMVKKIPMNENRIQDNKGSGHRRFTLPGWAKYAAVFLGFALLLQIIGLEVSQKGNALMVSFGEPSIETIDAGDVDLIVAKALDSYKQSQNNEFVNFRNEVNSELGQLSNAVMEISENNELNVDQLKNFLNKNLDQQYANLQSTIEYNNDSQRQEMEDSFTGLVEYLNNNRAKDQLKIQNAFSDIATAINNQHYQTNVLLTSISSEDTGLKSY